MSIRRENLGVKRGRGVDYKNRIFTRRREAAQKKKKFKILTFFFGKLFAKHKIFLDENIEFGIARVQRVEKCHGFAKNGFDTLLLKPAHMGFLDPSVRK